MSNENKPVATEPSRAQLLARIAELEKQNAGIRVAGKITLKVSEKGALSAYGLQRWPVTLYVEQWKRLLGAKDAITQFITDNETKFSVKAQA